MNKYREIILSEADPIERIVHLLSDDQEWALKSAMAANRPLLVRGEPGIGKTQLALAAAKDPLRPRPIVTYGHGMYGRRCASERPSCIHELVETPVEVNLCRCDRGCCLHTLALNGWSSERAS
ncbi:MAG: hypothetical protein O3A00_17885 [Planctomycetota bacterium]|nr:hypothetical protein [Planctomycetota bacterium]